MPQFVVRLFLCTLLLPTLTACRLPFVLPQEPPPSATPATVTAAVLSWPTKTATPPPTETLRT